MALRGHDYTQAQGDMKLADQNSEQVIADLRRSLAWLDLALATLKDGVIVLDGDMKATFANDALAEMVGKPRILLLGTYVWDVVSLRRGGRVFSKATFLQARRKRTIESLSGIYDLYSNNKPLNVELSIAHIPNTELTVVVIRDVTERLEAQAHRLKAAQEQAAREAAEISERRMLLQYKVASILAGSPEQKEAIIRIMEIICKSLKWQVGIMWAFDPEVNQLRASLISCGEPKRLRPFIHASRKVSFSKGQGLPGRVWEEKKPLWIQDVTKENNFPRLQTALNHKIHGAFAVPLESGGEFIGVIEFFSNHIEEPNMELLTNMSTVGIQIAEFVRRKKIESSLKQSEQRFRFMADSMPHMIYTAEPDGTIDYINPQFTHYTGLSLHMRKQKGWAHYIHPDDLETSEKAWDIALENKDTYQVEHRLRRVDGTYRWHLSRAHALRDDNGDIVMWIGADTDIDDLKRNMELEEIATTLRKQRTHLLELNSAKDEFISLASHQLRTPATGVKQFIGMLIEGYGGELTEAQKKFAEKAWESNERQITIINDLLKVAQVDAGKVTLKKEKTNLIQLIRNILDEQKIKFVQRDQSILYSPDYKMLHAFIDVKHFRMALENIIDNASKYTESKKTIEVTIKTQTGQAIITVKDEGVGIAKNDIEKIFYKFTRIDNPLSVTVGGTGLGLYWCKKIIELHGGTVTVSSRPKKGTAFVISVPLK